MMRDDEQPEMTTLDVSEVQEQLRHLLDQVQCSDTRVLVEEEGVVVAALISIHDLKRFEHLAAQRREEFKALYVTRAAFADVPDEEIEREVAKAIAEVRAENRERQAAALAEAHARNQQKTAEHATIRSGDV